MDMRRILSVCAGLLIAASANAQSSASACGPLPQPTARQVLKVFGELRVCLLALNDGPLDGDLPREWAARASTLVLETQRPDDNRRAAIGRTGVSWTVNGREAPQDSLAQAWQKAVVDLADAVYQADQLRSRSAELRERIESLPARIAETRGRIDYVNRRANELNLKIANANRGDAALRSQITQAQSMLSNTEMRASRERARASSARDDRERAAAERAAQQLDQAADGIRRQIDDLQLKLMDGNSRLIADAQEELRALRPEHTLTLLRLELSSLETMNVDDLNREMQELDAPARQPALDAEVQAALSRLRAILR